LQNVADRGNATQPRRNQRSGAEAMPELGEGIVLDRSCEFKSWARKRQYLQLWRGAA
jgi:hypothetical protein